MAGKNWEHMSFEKKLARLEEIVRLMEQGDTPLQASLALYTEGAELIRACAKELDEAEQSVKQLKKGPNGPLEKPMEDDLDDDEYYGLCSGI